MAGHCGARPPGAMRLAFRNLRVYARIMNPDSPACLCIAMRQTSRRVTALYDEALAPAGINVAQFSLLRKLRRHGPQSLSALAERVELDRSTLGRNLRVLEKLDLVTLGPGEDQRESVAALTSSGRMTLSAGDPLWDGAQARIAGKIGAEGVAQLNALLSAL
jgi:DNA-binding MarR family transcriptional regulator